MSTDVESEAVSIQLEREDLPVALQMQPLLSRLSIGDEMPLRVMAQFADGSRLDVTHSSKISFEPKDLQVVRVATRVWRSRRVEGKLPSWWGISSSVYAAIIVLGPGGTLKGLVPATNAVSPKTTVSSAAAGASQSGQNGNVMSVPNADLAMSAVL